MYMLNYKNTHQRKVSLMRRVAAFVNQLLSGTD